MAVLRDPATLQQLWKGSQRNYRWGGRQPLRRRRGDVHGDLSAVVIRLDWAGGACPATYSYVCHCGPVQQLSEPDNCFMCQPGPGSL